jgi:glutamine phosphoribosylpyrophosphate amidotransferase
MRSRKEFIARDKDGEVRDWDDICEEIGADSLAYIQNNDLEKIIGFPICRGCIDFPTGYPKELQKDVLRLYAKDKDGKRAYE